MSDRYKNIPAPDLSVQWDKAKLRNWMKNVRRLGREDIYRDALRQLCSVEGRDIADPIEAEIETVVPALEEAQRQ